MKIVEITWLDSGGIDGHVWDYKDDYTWKATKHKTIGYLLKRKTGYQYVAQSYTKSQYGRVFRIPLKAIISVRKLS